MNRAAKLLDPQRGYGFLPRVAGAERRLPWELPHPIFPNPNGVASMPESIPDVSLVPALAMKPQKLPVFVLECVLAVMLLLVVNISGHDR